MITGECIHCDATFEGADQQEVVGLFDVHHAEHHRDEPPMLRFSRVEDIDASRVTKRSLLLGALGASDAWAARHVEDGISLTDERRAYRQKLRGLLGELERTADPSKIELPEPPPPPEV